MTRTTITIEVLSESPLSPTMDLEAIHYAITDGDCVGTVTWGREETLTGKEMADALYAAGSEPGFFCLDDDGNEQ